MVSKLKNLSQMIENLKNNSEKIEQMSQSAKSLHKKGTAKEIAQLLIEKANI